MLIFSTQINQITFEGVENFCKEKHPEGIELDYKQDFPKNLSKIIAAFANTRGGVIILGVKENPDTGLPISWAGIPNQGKLLERVHQFATNVDPIPPYDVYVTDEKKGKVFVLIRVLEGEATPYYVHNDSNIYVRTGSVAKLVDLASPDYQELLFGKREKAKGARENLAKRAEDVYFYGLARAERERKRLHAQNDQQKKDNENPSKIEKIWDSPLEISLGECTIAVMPYYPAKMLIHPLELKDSLNEVQSRGAKEFPYLPHSRIETIPDGVFAFHWQQFSGYIESYQLYSRGLILQKYDAVTIDIERGERHFYLASLASHLYAVLDCASKFFSKVDYTGLVKGFVSLEKMQDDILIHPIVPSRWTYRGDHRRSFLPKYYFEIDTSTFVLQNSDEFRKYFLEVLKTFYTYFNYTIDKEEVYLDFFRESKMFS